MMEMHQELETVRNQLQDKTAELNQVRGQVSHDRGQMEAATQDQLDQLRHELHVAKSALEEMKQERGWRNSRETSVDVSKIFTFNLQ